MTRISPMEPASGSTDCSSLVLYNRGLTLATTEDVAFALVRKTMHQAPPTAAISQFVNPMTEQAEQKWLLCFNCAEEATAFHKRKQWVASALEIPETTLGVRPNKGPDPQMRHIININTQTG